MTMRGVRGGRQTAGDSNSLYPAWSPDGGKLAFMSSRKLDGSDAGNPQSFYNIWLVAPDGAGLTPLTKVTAATCGSPAWSPDGSSVLFASSRKLDRTDAINPRRALTRGIRSERGRPGPVHAELGAARG